MARCKTSTCLETERNNILVLLYVTPPLKWKNKQLAWILNTITPTLACRGKSIYKIDFENSLKLQTLFILIGKIKVTKDVSPDKTDSSELIHNVTQSRCPSHLILYFCLSKCVCVYSGEGNNKLPPERIMMESLRITAQLHFKTTYLQNDIFIFLWYTWNRSLLTYIHYLLFRWVGM